MENPVQQARPPITFQAVCFAANDYAGFWRRILVELVDVATIVFLLVLVAVILFALDVVEEPLDPAVWLCWGAAAYWYFVSAKRSRFHTVGYRLGGVRIVDVYGQTPCRRALILRLLWAVLGPINIVFDMLWIPSDPCKQSLRDKMAHTYVVKVNAHRVGPAQFVFRSYHIMGMSFIFQEIEPAGTSPAS
jgi:uncharacterized RDD family membrane protein YckC